MSRSERSNVRIGCPQCDATVMAAVPRGTGIQQTEWGDRNRLQGRETACDNCGHELELYYY